MLGILFQSDNHRHSGYGVQCGLQRFFSVAVHILNGFITRDLLGAQFRLFLPLMFGFWVVSFCESGSIRSYQESSFIGFGIAWHS